MGTIGWTAIFLSIVLGLVGRLLATEIGVWHKPLCDLLVHLAAVQLPKKDRIEVEAEWLAIISDIRSPSAQLFHSINYLLKARRIRSEILDVEWLETISTSRTATVTVVDKICYILMVVLAVVGGITLTLAVVATPIWLKILWGLVATSCFMTAVWLSTVVSNTWFAFELPERFDELIQLLREKITGKRRPVKNRAPSE